MELFSCEMQSTQSLDGISKYGDERFHHLTAPVENLEAYRPGGYHPLYLGDHLHNQRYTILRKLGYGSYSTVWLARDQRCVFAAII
jgi:hypothetical protein